MKRFHCFYKRKYAGSSNQVDRGGVKKGFPHWNNVPLSIELNVDIYLAVCLCVQRRRKDVREERMSKNVHGFFKPCLRYMFVRADLRVCQGR